MYLRFGKGGGGPPDPYPGYIDLIHWDFETAGEGFGGTGTFVNQGTLPITCTIENSPALSSVWKNSGAASVLFSGGGSFGFSLGGDTMMDIGASPTCVFEYAVKSTALTGSRIIFGWGTDVGARFLLNVDAGEVQATTVRGGVLSSRAIGSTLTDTVPAFIRVILTGGTIAVEVDGVLGTPVAETGAFTVAAFGDAVRWGREPFTTASYWAGYLDDFKMRVPPP